MGAFMILMFSIMIFLTVFVAIAGAVTSVVSRSRSKKGAMQLLEDVLREHDIEDYDYEQFDDGQIIMNDKDYGRIFNFNANGQSFGLSYEDITDVELIVDDSVAYQTSLSSATGRAIIGGVLAGGLGAVIGGVTGKKNGKKTVNKIELLISYSNYDFPYSRITLIESRQGEEVSEYLSEIAYEKGLLWSRRISAMMKEVEDWEEYEEKDEWED